MIKHITTQILLHLHWFHTGLRRFYKYNYSHVTIHVLVCDFLKNFSNVKFLHFTCIFNLHVATQKLRDEIEFPDIICLSRTLQTYVYPEWFLLSIFFISIILFT